MRYDNWKVVFMEQRCKGTLRRLGRTVHRLRLPKIFNLRTDPYEFADITSNSYYDWMLPQRLFIFAAQVIGGQVRRDLQGIPAVQRPNSFTIDDAMAKMVLTGPGGGQVGRTISDEDVLIGDPVLTAEVGWKAGKVSFAASGLLNIPIGQYQEGALANLSFNRWAGDASLAATWRDKGWDISGKAGLTANGENEATLYTTGTEFHLEGAIEKTFSKTWSAGLQAYHFQQLSSDRGPGAVLGPFKGRVSGVGATAAYNFEIGRRPATRRPSGSRHHPLDHGIEIEAGRPLADREFLQRRQPLGRRGLGRDHQEGVLGEPFLVVHVAVGRFLEGVHAQIVEPVRAHVDERLAPDIKTAPSRAVRRRSASNCRSARPAARRRRSSRGTACAACIRPRP
jgi:hypothetical protein